MCRFLEALLGYLGAPKGESPLFYRDVALGFVFVASTLVALILLVEMRINALFWTAASLAAGCMILATKRLVLVAALLGIAALRLALGFFWFGNFYLLLGSAACAVLALIAAAADTSDYPNR